MHVLFIIDYEARHEAVQLFYATLPKIAGGAEILVSRAARRAAGVGAGVPYHGCHKIAATNARDSGARLHHFAQRFMPQHQEIEPRGRRAVMETADLAIRSADTDFEHAQLDLIWRRDLRLVQRDQFDSVLPRKNRAGFHCAHRPSAAALLGPRRMPIIAKAWRPRV